MGINLAWSHQRTYRDANHTWKPKQPCWTDVLGRGHLATLFVLTAKITNKRCSLLTPPRVSLPGGPLITRSTCGQSHPLPIQLNSTKEDFCFELGVNVKDNFLGIHWRSSQFHGQKPCMEHEAKGSGSFHPHTPTLQMKEQAQRYPRSHSTK